MNKERRERVEKAGFKLGSIQEFLELIDEEVACIEAAPKTPNPQTRKVIEKSRMGINVIEYNSVDDLLKSLKT